MQERPRTRLTGMLGFSLVWVGQLISVLASGISAFAMTIWMYKQTQSATAMAFVQVAYITPFLLITPIAGVMVDRYSRKLMMMISDIMGGIALTALFLLFRSGDLQFWHVYITTAFAGIGAAFQWPAYSAAISTMIPKEQYGRANGMMGLMETGPGVVAPLLAGALIPFLGIDGLLLIDAITYGVAILALAVVFIPDPVASAEGDSARGNWLSEAAFGFRYIFQRPSLLGLQLVFFAGNLFSGISGALIAPMILARTNQNALALASVNSTASIAMVVGGVIISAWGGLKRRVHGVLLGWILDSLGAMFLFGLGRGLEVWLPVCAFGALFSPLINTSNQSIWQAKVAPDLQGRVFSARRLIAWLTNPISPIIGGTLADFVLEPAMKTPQGFAASVLQPIFGSGPGAGMAVVMSLCGLMGMLVGLAGYRFSVIRNAETILPDHDAPAAQPA